jgi:hypothetical protein
MLRAHVKTANQTLSEFVGAGNKFASKALGGGWSSVRWDGCGCGSDIQGSDPLWLSIGRTEARIQNREAPVNRKMIHVSTLKRAYENREVKVKQKNATVASFLGDLVQMNASC